MICYIEVTFIDSDLLEVPFLDNDLLYRGALSRHDLLEVPF